MIYITVFLSGIISGMFDFHFLRLIFKQIEWDFLVEALYYFALPKSILIRQLMLRDVQLKVILRKSPRVRTTPIDRILILIRGLPAWKDHVSIVAASTVRNWMLQFPKGIWSLRTWLGILKSSFLMKLGIKKKRASHKREEILDAMRIILFVDRIRGVDRIHGELKRIGFDVSRPTIANYLRIYFPQLSNPPKNGVTPRQLLTSIWNAWATDFFVQLTFSDRAVCPALRPRLRGESRRSLRIHASLRVTLPIGGAHVIRVFSLFYAPCWKVTFVCSREV